MAKGILGLFGWLSIITGLVLMIYALTAGGRLVLISFLPAAVGLLIAGAPLVVLDEIVTRLERVARTTKLSIPVAPPQPM